MVVVIQHTRVSVDVCGNTQSEHLLLSYYIGLLEAFGSIPAKRESNDINTKNYNTSG